MFPHDAVPDNAIFAPHHLYIGVILLLVGTLIVWDNQADDPHHTLLTTLGLLFAFTFIWPYYPLTGALIALMALVILPISLYVESSLWRSHRRAIALTVVGYLIAVDDIVEHAFGIPTPLDWLFTLIRPLLV